MRKVFAYPKKRARAGNIFQSLKRLAARMKKRGGWKTAEDSSKERGCIWQRALSEEFEAPRDAEDSIYNHFVEAGAPDNEAVKGAVDTLINVNDHGGRDRRVRIDAAIKTIQEELQKP